MRDLIDHFIDFMDVERGVSPNTILSYRKDIEKFFDYIEKKKKDISGVTREDILGFLMHLKDQELSATTIARNGAVRGAR